MPKRYYTAESAHGSETSHGFCDDTVVRVWADKRARDTYVQESPNISVQSILRSQVTRFADNTSGTGKLNPFKGEYWGIVEQWGGPIADGHIGNLEVCGSHDSQTIIDRLNQK